MRICVFILAAALAGAALAADAPTWATRDLRAGIIGADTSHVPGFTRLFQEHPEWF